METRNETYNTVHVADEHWMGSNGSNMLNTDNNHNNMEVHRRNKDNFGATLLVNYTNLDGAVMNIIDGEMTFKPNLQPPNFLLLTLTAQGTRTKSLGHDVEKGGWAIPTPSNGYVSKFDNLPHGAAFHMRNVRTLPFVERAGGAHDDQFAAYQNSFDLPFNSTAIPANGALRPPHGFAYDAPPLTNDGNDSPLGPTFPDPNLFIAGRQYLPIHNFSQAARATFAHPSTRIIFRSQAEEHKKPRAVHVPENSRAFGRGNFRLPADFTVSMIEPSWIYTTVTDATVQTLNFQVSWGDTQECIDETSGQPSQFTIIASP